MKYRTFFSKENINVNIDNIFKNYYFVLEDNTIIKNNSILIPENKLKKDNNDYKIFIQS